MDPYQSKEASVDISEIVSCLHDKYKDFIL